MRVARIGERTSSLRGRYAALRGVGRELTRGGASRSALTTLRETSRAPRCAHTLHLLECSQLNRYLLLVHPSSPSEHRERIPMKPARIPPSSERNLPPRTLDNRLASPLRTRQRRPRFRASSPFASPPPIPTPRRSPPPPPARIRTEAKLAPRRLLTRLLVVIPLDKLPRRLANISVVPLPTLAPSHPTSTTSAPRSAPSSSTSSGSSGRDCGARSDAASTNGFGAGVLDDESAAVEHVVPDVEEGAGAHLGKVEVDESPSAPLEVSGEEGERGGRTNPLHLPVSSNVPSRILRIPASLAFERSLGPFAGLALTRLTIFFTSSSLFSSSLPLSSSESSSSRSSSFSSSSPSFSSSTTSITSASLTLGAHAAVAF